MVFGEACAMLKPIKSCILLTNIVTNPWDPHYIWNYRVKMFCVSTRHICFSLLLYIFSLNGSRNMVHSCTFARMMSFVFHIWSYMECRACTQWALRWHRWPQQANTYTLSSLVKVYVWFMTGFSRVFCHHNGSVTECLFGSSDHIKLSSHLITCKNPTLCKHWRIHRGARDATPSETQNPISFILMQFSAKMLPNNKLVSPPLGLARTPVWETLDTPLVKLLTSSFQINQKSITCRKFGFWWTLCRIMGRPRSFISRLGKNRVDAPSLIAHLKRG